MDYFKSYEEWKNNLPYEHTNGPVRVISLKALSEAPRPPSHVNGMRWGKWRFDARQLTLTHTDVDYEIDLEKLNTCAEMLDWIFQAATKTWCSPEDAGHLLTALRVLLHPQANLCSFGAEKKFDASRHLKAQVYSKVKV